MSGERWTARGGWTIEIVVRHGRPGYRVLRYGHLIAYCAGLEELAERLEVFGLDLGDLVEDDLSWRGRFHRSVGEAGDLLRYHSDDQPEYLVRLGRRILAAILVGEPARQ